MNDSPVVVLTQREVAKRLGITQQEVARTERKALAKLRAHPTMRRLARECGIDVGP